MAEDANADVKLALEEMRRNLQQSLDAGDAIDRKLNSILVASGAILTLIGALKLSISGNHSVLFWTIFFITIGLYTLSIFLVMLGASPKHYKMPIASEWDELASSIFGKSERDVILKLLSGYVTQIPINRKINQEKARYFSFSVLILLVIVILLLLLVIIK
jgi:hypothetical protein